MDRQQILSFFDCFKMSLLGEGFHTLKVWFVLLPNQCGTSQSTLPSKPSILAGTLFSLQSMCGTDPNPPPFGLNILTGTPPHVYPLQRTARRLAHIVRCLALIPFITTQIHHLPILSYFGFPFRASPQDFKTRLLGESSTPL